MEQPRQAAAVKREQVCSTSVKTERGSRVVLDIGVFGARGIPSTYSGYETFLTVLLPELAARGHRVTMYCRNGEVPDARYYRGVRCVRLPAFRSKQLSTPSHGLVAAASARAARHDVVFVVNVANAAYCLLSRLSGQRMVLNTDGQEWLRGKWGVVGRRVFRSSAGLARWAANAVVADCNAMRSVYLEEFATDSTVIPYCWAGVVPSEPPPNLRSMGLSARRYFIAGGRLVPENQVAEITRAYLGSGLPHPIVVLGTANYRSPVSVQLEWMAAHDQRVILGGHIDDRAGYCGLVRDALAYIHGHLVGGMNPSLLDAMGSGARIVAASTPFNRETLGEAGDYFERPDHALSKLLRVVAVETPEAGDARRSAARSRALSHFSLTAVSAAHEALFLAVALRPVWTRTRLETQWEKALTPPPRLEPAE